MGERCPACWFKVKSLKHDRRVWHKLCIAVTAVFWFS